MMSSSNVRNLDGMAWLSSVDLRRVIKISNKEGTFRTIVLPKKPGYPNTLTDLHRFRKTAHGHDGSSRIVMVRKTDQRTIASMRDGQNPKLETITRETIETFRGQRTECKVTTEKKDCQDNLPAELIDSFTERIRTPTRKLSTTKRTPIMEFQNECLKAHNEYRQKHGVPPLKLNKEMCRLSQIHADYLSRKAVLEHSKNRDYGENIYCISSGNPNISITGDDPVRNWYNELDKHQFGIEPSNLSSGHFTQVVWKESKELGVAFAKHGGKIVVVANYSPPGNIIGQFSENVPPLGGFSKEINGNHVEKLSESVSKISVSSRNIPIGTEGDFEQDFLKAHNEYRKKHGVPPLKLDRKLCKLSEEWAKILASKNILEHRKNSPYGENIYCMYSSDHSFTITGHTPVDTWYEEVKNHPFGREPNSLKSGHFTQVIWKTSELLGVGVARSRQGYIYVVGNYSPAGNFVGHYAENVPPPLKSTSISEKDEDELLSCSTSKDVTESVLKDSDFDQFALDGLKVHNELRRKHGVPIMILKKELCYKAQEWADHCARTGTLSHRPTNAYGENIICMFSSDYSHIPSARDAVKKWYDEVKEHVYGVESVNHKTLHFSQIVWKNSTELGIALAKNKNGQSYVVANYNPRGNIVGQFVANVLKPKP